MVREEISGNLLSQDATTQVTISRREYTAFSVNVGVHQ